MGFVRTWFLIPSLHESQYLAHNVILLGFVEPFQWSYLLASIHGVAELIRDVFVLCDDNNNNVHHLMLQRVEVLVQMRNKYQILSIQG